MPHEIIAGIDLGTTNSAIGVLQDGSPRLINIDGRPTMPSCVGFGENGEVLTGQPALNQLAVAPHRTVASIKRKMGDDAPVKLGDGEYRPEEISAFILRRLKEEAERDLGEPVAKAVITVPAYFDEKQRRATQDAAKLAGLECVRILNEPTAAALAYNPQNQSGQTILVYDLGGGTFDVSLVVCEEGLVEVKASHGDTKLGGDDFDDALAEFLAEKHGNLDLSDPVVGRRIKVAAEAAKCRLSDHPFAEIREEYVSGDDHFEFELSREQFEELIAPKLEKTWESMHAALRDGGVLTQDVDKILLVGGSTRIPMVHRIIKERIGQQPSSEVNPDLIVALGAAIQGGIIAGEEAGSILVDIATHTFSTAAVIGIGQRECVPIIPRGTPLPTTRSDAFETLCDSQDKVEVDVYQGESRELHENLEIGNFMVEGLSDVPAGNVILCQFSLDLNGMLEVTATEKSTGLAKAVSIDTRDVEAGLDLAEARDRLAEVFGDEPEPEDESEPIESTQISRATSLEKRAEVLLSSDLEDEDAQDIRGLLDKSRDAVKTHRYDDLNVVSEQLEDILFYLEN